MATTFVHRPSVPHFAEIVPPLVPVPVADWPALAGAHDMVHTFKLLGEFTFIEPPVQVAPTLLGQT